MAQYIAHASKCVSSVHVRILMTILVEMMTCSPVKKGVSVWVVICYRMASVSKLMNVAADTKA